MPAPTPGYVKNMIRRSLREIVDPSPTKKDKVRIREFFDSECAYCGKKINNPKEGHIDHLVPSSLGGANHISNRVLSCASCNAEEKLDIPWQKFLEQKIPDKTIAKKRKEKIMQWQKKNRRLRLEKDVLQTISLLADETVEFYDRKIEKARQLRNKDL